MNLLIISYSNNNIINVYNYNLTLYLIKNITSENKKQLLNKHVSIIKEKNIYLEIINQTRNYYKDFDYILILDNKNKYNIDNFNFDRLPKNWIMSGNKNKEKFYNNELYAKSFQLNELCFNCRSLQDSFFNECFPEKINNIHFDYFSKIIYNYYDKMFLKLYSGITKKNDNESILI